MFDMKEYLQVCALVREKKDACGMPQWTYEIIRTFEKQLYDGSYNSTCTMWLMEVGVPVLGLDRECLEKLDLKVMLKVLKAISKGKLLVAREKLKEARDKRKELILNIPKKEN